MQVFFFPSEKSFSFAFRNIAVLNFKILISDSFPLMNIHLQFQPSLYVIAKRLHLCILVTVYNKTFLKLRGYYLCSVDVSKNDHHNFGNKNQEQDDHKLQNTIQDIYANNFTHFFQKSLNIGFAIYYTSFRV